MNIEINIKGPVGCGKTAILALIANTLISEGMQVVAPGFECDQDIANVDPNAVIIFSETVLINPKNKSDEFHIFALKNLLSLFASIRKLWQG